MAPPPRGPAPRRNPSILAADSGDRRPQQARRQPSRFITVDSVLQYASDIPSAQQRRPQRPRQSRTMSGRPLDPRLSGRFAPSHMPPRSTKTSEKLVLLPEAIEEDEEKGEFGATAEDTGPPKDDEDYRRPGREKSKSYAERLPKHKRTEKELPRVTAFCTAQAYKLQSTATFVRQRHGARAKLYDDCLYCAYHLPLLPGTDGYRLLSSPPVVSAKGGMVLDEAIERSEQRNYRGDFDEEEEEHSVRGDQIPEDANQYEIAEQEDERAQINGIRRDSTGNFSARSVSPTGNTVPTDAYRYAEMFVFSYGVVVFWNFTERQEKDVLADLTFATLVDEKGHITSSLSLTTNPLDEEDFETEEFHFEYNNELSRPRIYNDMITLRSGDHMIKLAISHAIAQSTKLSFFEETMAGQMEAAKDVPARLAKTGELGMKREEVIKLLGGLFKSRVDVNLSSNVLDTPNLIWEDEPTLHPLYTALTEYLEIKPRIQVLNERCRVFLDLAEVLSDYVSDNKMSRITWIIIVLIGISILVTCSEVFLRFGILTAKKGHAGANVIAGSLPPLSHELL
ncbi:Sad1-interacting factor 3 [Knufia fluminis]|uniref:Sad1-interacting factor 3 n=1 Tax=Knufia fluminis TaxID=191047 RepID=A0AAN8E8V6_9EURO|nr:Sad1-interacting factor 3 [Knufia fluminis]